jgi:hypothetical protein
LRFYNLTDWSQRHGLPVELRRWRNVVQLRVQRLPLVLLALDLQAVSLTMDSTNSKTRTSYLLVACKVPAFAGVRKSSAVAVWTAAGFNWANLFALTGKGNYKIGLPGVGRWAGESPRNCSAPSSVVGP